ncbi:MAG: class I SAM-dependent methyltransferase, partial [Acidimicrobiia bacterium]|nr:class I SAM-dependent methyltransferase [Acidimicrobiia bacterium]
MICATNSFVLPGAVQDRWGRFWQWAQAILQARCNVEYELKVAAKKQALFSGIKGDVLEIGPGTGANLVYLPVGVRWIGVEPNTYMHAYLRESGARSMKGHVKNKLQPRRLAKESFMDSLPLLRRELLPASPGPQLLS